MENQLLEINRDLMIYEGKINHSAKKQKVLTKPSECWRREGFLGEVMSILQWVHWGCQGSVQEPSLTNPYSHCWVSAAVRGWQVCLPEDLKFFFLTEVVMIHVLMVVLGLDKEEGEDAA